MSEVEVYFERAVVWFIITSYNVSESNRLGYDVKGERIMEMKTDRVVSYSLEDSAKIVLDMLDEAIDEYERGEFISEEELFRDLESMK